MKCSYALSQWIEGIIFLLFPPNFVVLFLALFLGNIFRPVQNIKILQCPSFNLFFSWPQISTRGQHFIINAQKGMFVRLKEVDLHEMLPFHSLFYVYIVLTKYIHTVKLVFQWLYLSAGLKLMLKWMQVLKFGYYFTGLTTIQGCVFQKHSKPIVDCSSYIILLILTMLLEITAQVVFGTGQWS